MFSAHHLFNWKWTVNWNVNWFSLSFFSLIRLYSDFKRCVSPTMNTSSQLQKHFLAAWNWSLYQLLRLVMRWNGSVIDAKVNTETVKYLIEIAIRNFSRCICKLQFLCSKTLFKSIILKAFHLFCFVFCLFLFQLSISTNDKIFEFDHICGAFMPMRRDFTWLKRERDS